MSDTATDRLSRARAEMDEAHARLVKAESALDGAPDAWGKIEAEAELLKSVACHSRALRELFLASLEALVDAAVAHELPQGPMGRVVAGHQAYSADGPAYRRLRHRASDIGETALVSAIDRLCDSEGTQEDVQLVARHLVLAGEHETADSLLRSVEG